MLVLDGAYSEAAPFSGQPCHALNAATFRIASRQGDQVIFPHPQALRPERGAQAVFVQLVAVPNLVEVDAFDRDCQDTRFPRAA